MVLKKGDHFTKDRIQQKREAENPRLISREKARSGASLKAGDRKSAPKQENPGRGSFTSVDEKKKDAVRVEERKMA